MSPSLRALLIGVGHYFPNRLHDGPVDNSYPSLEGAVRDVARMERYLCEEIGLAPERISKLTVTASANGGPPEPPEQWPTYENMIAAFRRLRDEAIPGEAVFIHYSGHGGRTPTIFPELKGSVPIDEALVPCDIGDPGSRYLRDVELAWLIQALVGKGLFVTLILDCCHSAGAARGPKKSVKRGLLTVDHTPRPLESLVATREELAESWSRRQGHRPADGPVMRGLSVKSWFPDPQGYVLVAACRPQESAFEFPFEGDESQGALTYHLLNALRQDGADQTCKRLQDKVQPGVRVWFPLQTPMLLGDASRTLFGLEKAAPRYEINVMDVHGGRVLLNVGQPHGFQQGARFAIYSPTARAAVVEIDQLGATESWARIVQSLRPAALERGAQAVPLDAGALALRRGVSVGREPDLGRVRKAIERGGRGFLRLAEDNSPVDFRVAVNARGEYEIQDEKGRPIPHLRPPLPVQERRSALEVVRRLIHLARYWNVRQIETLDPDSPDSLAGRVVLEIVDGPCGRVELKPGEKVSVRMANRSSHDLNVTILDLRPDWGISQFFPSRKDTEFWPLEPGQEKVFEIEPSLPDGYEEGVDVLKLFATRGASSYRWLELPALDRPDAEKGRVIRGPRDADGWPEFAISGFPSEEWVTAEVEIRVRR